MADAFPISGQIDPKGFPFLLMDLHRHGATGSLKVEGPSYQKALYFRGGRVLFGSSNDPRDQLGAILVESGKITPEQLEDVNAKVGPGNPLAKVLSETGLVNQRELSEAARAKVERILSDVLSYESGAFEFEDGVLPKGAIDLKLSTEKLVLAAVRRDPDRALASRLVPGPGARLVPKPDLAAHLGDFGADGRGIPAQIDGSRTVDEIAGASGVDVAEVTAVGAALALLGLVEIRGGSAEAGGGLSFDDEDDPTDGTLQLDAASLFAQMPPADAGPNLGADDSAPPLFSSAPEPAFGAPEAAPSFDPPPTEGFPAVPPPGEPQPSYSDDSPTFVSPSPLAPEVPFGAPPPEAAPEQEEPEPEPAPEPEPPRRGSKRPSKDDLAALDALLNAPDTEGPLEPLEKPALGAAAERWAPKFDQRAPNRRGGGRDPKMTIVFGGLAAALLAAAAWYSLAGAPEPAPPAARATPAAAAPPTTVAPGAPGPPSSTASPAPPASASAAPATPPSAAPATAVKPAGTTPVPVTTLAAAPPATRPPAATSPAAAAPGGGAPNPGEARSLLARGSLPEAARAFMATVAAAPRGSASVQLLVACSAETVQKAVAAANAPELFIVPVSLKGRDCFRLCWGLYPSEAAAATATRSVPAYFRAGGAAPRVITAAEIAKGR